MTDSAPPDYDLALMVLVSTINELVEPQSDGPGVTLTVHGLTITGKVVPNWQWFEEMERQCRDSYVTNGGAPDAEGAGWAVLFKTVGASLITQRDEYGVMRAATSDLPDRYQQALADVDQTAYIHLREARTFPTSGQPGLPGNGMHWRGRLSDISGWSFGLLGPAEAEA